MYTMSSLSKMVRNYLGASPRCFSCLVLANCDPAKPHQTRSSCPCSQNSRAPGQGREGVLGLTVLGWKNDVGLVQAFWERKPDERWSSLEPPRNRDNVFEKLDSPGSMFYKHHATEPNTSTHGLGMFSDPEKVWKLWFKKIGNHSPPLILDRPVSWTGRRLE